MKFCSIVWPLALVVACLILLIGVEANETGQLSNKALKLPKIFEFDKFVALYHRNYASISERLNRMRLFMARAFMVFVKAVQYNNRVVGYYLAINDKSDWTDEERAKLYQLTDGTSQQSQLGGDESGSNRQSVSDFVVDSREEIERILAEIVEHKDASPEFHMIANELGQVRNKRDAAEPDQRAPSERHLSPDQLMRDPERIRASSGVSPKLVASVPSNNPDYREPELMSEGVDEDDADKQAGATGEVVVEVPAQRDDNFVSNVLRSFDSLWSVGREKKHESEKLTAASSGETRVYFDYRDSNCILPIKDQRRCGSCYAFSTMAVYEYLHCKQTGKLVSFSEQFVVDCGGRFAMSQCNGGRIDKVAEFVNTVGLELASYYPYRARETMCPYEDSDKLSQMGHTKVKNGRMVVLSLPLMYEDQIVRLLKTRGPLTFTIQTNKEFVDYGGGVHRLQEPNAETGHAMTLVGHGIEQGEEYWLIRNSYGISWGEEGYYKLSKDNVDPRALLWVSYVEADFSENRAHKVDKVRENVLKNRNIIERLFNL